MGLVDFSTINLLMSLELIVIGLGTICVVYLLKKNWKNK